MSIPSQKKIDLPTYVLSVIIYYETKRENLSPKFQKNGKTMRAVLMLFVLF